MARSPRPAAPAAERVRDEMLHEARSLIDQARVRGVTIRLIGGLAVRAHCRTADLCARDYSDLDMVGLASDRSALPGLFAGFGYTENQAVGAATAYGELQFVRPCAHDGRPPGGHPHPDDHVDVFLDTFRMDHDIALARRLAIEPYTVPLSDLLLTKLQISRLNEKDVRDVVTLLADHEVGDRDDRDTIDGRRIGALCAADWGLFYDVTTNLQRIGERLVAADLGDARQSSVRRGLARLIGAIDEAPKNVLWRLRARVGTRVSWHNEPDDQE